MRIVDGAKSGRWVARMGSTTAEGGTHHERPFVDADDFHLRRLSHDCRGRSREMLPKIVDQARNADAAKLFVVRQRQIERPSQTVRRERDHLGQTARNKAFHVRRAAAVEPAVRLAQDERITAPALPINADNVGMTRK